jgi:thiol-disulfide isomerase/thioredoxin
MKIQPFVTVSWREGGRESDGRFSKALGRVTIIFLLTGIIVIGGITGLTLLKNHGLQMQTSMQSSSLYDSHTSGSVESLPTSTTDTSITDSTTITLATFLDVGVQDGELAPNFPITFVNGSASQSLYDLHGRPVLLWFVATWCTSCQQGAQMLSSKYYSDLESKGVTILTIELYNDLGQSGPNLTQFANQYGGGLNKQGWYYGYSNQTTTYTFDPKAALDVYYALNAQGIIVTQGIELPNGLQSLVVDTSWYSS